jgi:uncharacterized protein YsxB (DUF464 family)
MITAEFRKSGDKLIGFKVGGHSGYAESGQDIICAAVSSAVELAECIINDTMYADAKVSVNNKTAAVSLAIKENDENARAVIEGLKIYLTYLSEQYPENIRVREV